MGITAFKLPELKKETTKESTESLQRLRRPLFIEATASKEKMTVLVNPNLPC